MRLHWVTIDGEPYQTKTLFQHPVFIAKVVRRLRRKNPGAEVKCWVGWSLED